MSKLIVITVDTNDGDFVTHCVEITDSEIKLVKDILNKMPRMKNWLNEEISCIRYETCEMGFDDKSNSEYTFISSEEKKLLSKFLPRGEYRIQTIESVEIVESIEKLL